MSNPPEQMPAVPARSARTKVVAVAALLAFGLAVIAYSAVLAKKPAPDVSYTDLAGAKMSTQSLRGKVVVVNFWATSCSTCIQEMPQLVDTYNKFKNQGFEMVAVAMKGDPPNYVVNYTETRKLPFKVVLDVQGELARSFGKVAMTPTTFVIDKQGNIIKRYVGEPEFPAFHKLLEKALAAT